MMNIIEIDETTEYKVKYEILLNYLKFQIENNKSVYISKDDLSLMIKTLEYIELKKEGGKNE